MCAISLMVPRLLIACGLACVAYALLVTHWLCPLHVRAHVGDLSGVEQLLQSGTGVDVRCDGYWGANGATALHEAARFGHHDVVAALIDAGADVSARTARGETALDMAVRSREGEMEAFLRQQLGGGRRGGVET